MLVLELSSLRRKVCSSCVVSLWRRSALQNKLPPSSLYYVPRKYYGELLGKLKCGGFLLSSGTTFAEHLVVLRRRGVVCGRRSKERSLEEAVGQWRLAVTKQVVAELRFAEDLLLSVWKLS